MYSKEFESKIKNYVKDGDITPQQRKELHDDAKEQNIDEEELDIVIDGYIYLAKHHMFDTSTSHIATAQTHEVNTSTSAYPADKDFNLKEFLLLITHNKWARLLAIILLVIVLSPFIIVLLFGFLALFQPSPDSKETITKNDSSATVAHVQSKKEAMTSKNATHTSGQAKNSEVETSAINKKHEGKINVNGRVFNVAAVDNAILIFDGDENKSPLSKNFEGNIEEIRCYGHYVYVVSNITEPEERRFTFYNVYKYDLLTEKSVTLIEYANDVKFDDVKHIIRTSTITSFDLNGATYDNKDFNM